MTRMRNGCANLEQDLVAAASAEADAETSRRIAAHVAVCGRCRGEYERYRAIEEAVAAWRRPIGGEEQALAARHRLDARLADVRDRTLTYHVFPSPLGHILIALSEQGVSLIDYLGRHHELRHSRLRRLSAYETREDGGEIETLYRELLQYLSGERTRLDWPLDLRLAASGFQREVLQATAGIPYGGVMSYAGVACEVGKPAAVRAVAQALRRNPLPIVIPCHRVVGSSGALVGYAGHRVELKERLLATEGVLCVKRAHEPHLTPQKMYVKPGGGDWYCLPTCRSLARITHPRRLVYFSRREAAEAAGLAPCTECRPDLHPISR